MGNVFLKIVEIEERAQEIFKEAKIYEENLQNEIKVKISKLEEDIQKKTDKKIAEISKRDSDEIENRLSEIKKKYKEKLAGLEKHFEQNKHFWEDDIFNRIIRR